MGKIGHGYGSEWHLLRFLGRHRRHLDAAILEKTGGAGIRWLDFQFSPSGFFDAEWVGVDFIEDTTTKDLWRGFWPSTGSAQNWDAIGSLHGDRATEYLLVEAKAHTGEIASDCGAKLEGGLHQITDTLDSIKKVLGVSQSADWLHGYYQYANRLACLRFLNSNNVPARLVMVYFCGENHQGWDCPKDEKGWGPALAQQDQHLGLTSGHPLDDRIHKVFVDVAGR